MAENSTYISIACQFLRRQSVDGVGMGGTVAMPGACADGERIERDWAAVNGRDWVTGHFVVEDKS